MSEYHEIGEPFSFDGTTLKAVKSEFTCFECYCRGKDSLCSQLKCTVGARKDKTDVVFKEVVP